MELLKSLFPWIMIAAGFVTAASNVVKLSRIMTAISPRKDKRESDHSQNLKKALLIYIVAFGSAAGAVVYYLSKMNAWPNLTSQDYWLFAVAGIITLVLLAQIFLFFRELEKIPEGAIPSTRKSPTRRDLRRRLVYSVVAAGASIVGLLAKLPALF